MHRIRTLAAALVALSGCLETARAQTAPLEQVDVTFTLDTGPVLGIGAARGPMHETTLDLGDVAWVRLLFDRIELGAPPPGGRPTILRITSLADGAVQTMNATHVAQWQYTSAYFNGHALKIEILADPGAGPSRVTARHAWAGPPVPIAPPSICGGVDDRVLSDDPRIGRKYPSGCTAWMIDDPNHCFLTAGHCTNGYDLVEFNVPLSNAAGAAQHPSPKDQYPIDPVSMQTNGGQGTGNDWAYFGCFENSSTGLRAHEAQGAWFTLAAAPPPVDGQLIEITGYGTAIAPVPPEWSRAQKTHAGPYVQHSGTTVQYQTDTTGGNSGSPVIDLETGLAIGIHTHGGCASGTNKGTAIDLPALQNALDNPLGVCIPAPFLPADVNEDFTVDVADLLLVLDAWGDCAAPCPPTCPGDVDDSCSVDVTDLLAVLDAWGSQADGSAHASSAQPGRRTRPYGEQP